jgi:hypothetical protein
MTEGGLSMIYYLNWRTRWGLETIDELDSSDYPTAKAAAAERARLLAEYAMAGMGGAYWSRRPCKAWAERD